METITGDLLIFEAPSIVSGFRALSSIPGEDQTGPLQIVDASPAGASRFLILVKGEAKRLQDVLKGMRDSVIDDVGHAEPVDHELIENANGAILEAAYSLLPQKLNGALLVIETETASAMFAAAHIFVENQKLTVLEIKIRKTGPGGAYALFTGPADQCALAAEDIKTRFRNAVREVRVSVFESPNESIRSLFEGA